MLLSSYVLRMLIFNKNHSWLVSLYVGLYLSVSGQTPLQDTKPSELVGQRSTDRDLLTEIYGQRSTDRDLLTAVTV